MKHKKITAFALAALLALLSLAACKSNDSDAVSSATQRANAAGTSVTPPAAADAGAAAASALDPTQQFTDTDLDVDWQAQNGVAVTFGSAGAQSDSDAVHINGSTVTITEEGYYVLSGAAENGQVIVEAEKTAKVHLVLNGLNLACASSAPIYVRQADKVIVTLAEGTENALCTSGEFIAIDDNNIDAVIFSKDDLTLNGSGALAVSTQYGHGVVSKDDLVLAGGSYTVSCTGHGLCGKDSVRIATGSFTLTTGKDGIHSENADDTSLGYVYIADGTFTVVAGYDGIDGAAAVRIDGGTFSLVTGGGSQNASTDAAGNQNPGWGQWGAKTTTETDTASAKGIKADGDVMITAGSLTIDSSDDGVHANGNVRIDGGALQLSSGDDGVHADAQTYIGGGTLDIAKSYEGIEGKTVELAGGAVTLVASDDGVNAAGGADSSSMGGRPGENGFASSRDSYIRISGGTLRVNVSGDGLDANGALYVTGGETYVSGPTNDGNGALDYDGTAAISGGIFVAAGSSGMAQNFSTSSTQGAMLVTAQSDQSGEITVQDSTGACIASYAPEKAYRTVVISTPALKQGESYTVQLGQESQTVTLTELVTGGGMGGWGGMGTPPQGGMPGNGQQTPGGMTPPGGKPQKGNRVPPSQSVPSETT